jgi:hypothetical protein
MAGRDRPHLCMVTNLSATSASTERRFGEPLLLWAHDAAAAIASHTLLLFSRSTHTRHANPAPPFPVSDKRGHAVDMAGDPSVANSIVRAVREVAPSEAIVSGGTVGPAANRGGCERRRVAQVTKRCLIYRCACRSPQRGSQRRWLVGLRRVSWAQ